MTTAAIIQARMGSSGVPGKVLADLGGAPVLDRVVARAAACPAIGQIVVATTDGAIDDLIADRARRLGVAVYRGCPHDVLARYAGAARAVRADVVVRLGGDCPLLDPAVIGSVVDALAGDVDYVSNTHTRSFPRGLDVEAFHADVLVRLARATGADGARARVTDLVRQHPAWFSICQVVAPEDDSDLRLTLDTRGELARVRAIWDQLDLGVRIAPYREVVDWLREHPASDSITAAAAQRPWPTAAEVRHGV